MNVKSPKKRRSYTKKLGLTVMILAVLCVFLLNVLLLLPHKPEISSSTPLPESEERQDLPEEPLTSEPEAEVPAPLSEDAAYEDTLYGDAAAARIEADDGPTSSPYYASTEVPSTLDEKEVYTERRSEADEEKVIYVVLDDAGASLSQVAPFLAFPAPLTIAVLPFLEESAEVSRAAHEAGHTVFLHLPLEAKGGNDPGPNAILVTHNDEEIRNRLQENLLSLPEVRGVNNHMGSLVTSNERVMRIILAEIKKRQLFFLDSRTTADTVIPVLAEELSIAFDSRHVFLDHDPSPDAIMQALEQSLRIADTQGYVIVIGHVTVGHLAEILQNAHTEFVSRGYVFRALRKS